MRQVRPMRWQSPGGGLAAGGVGPVAATLIAASVGVFILQLVDRSIELRFANVPLAVAGGQYYRLISAAFLHGGPLHLGLNMFAIVLVGREVEAALGRARFLALYLASALGGSVGFYLFGSPGGRAFGASTATFGLFGALFVLARARQIDTRQIFMLIVLNLFLGAVIPGIDNLGHVGGLVTGAAMAFAFEAAERLRPPVRVLAQVAAVAAIVALLSMLVVTRNPEARSSGPLAPSPPPAAREAR
jgi:membrane associated rhomboid family serine protease